MLISLFFWAAASILASGNVASPLERNRFLRSSPLLLSLVPSPSASASSTRALLQSLNSPVLKLQPYVNTTRIFLYESCVNSTDPLALAPICSRQCDKVFMQGEETAWRVPVTPTPQPIYIQLTSDRDIQTVTTDALTVAAAGWTVSAVTELVRGRQFIFRVDPAPLARAHNVSLRVPAGAILPANVNGSAPFVLPDDGNVVSNALYAYFDEEPPAPVFASVRRSPLSFESAVFLQLDYQEPLLENCRGGACLFEATTESGAPVPTRSSYDPDTGLILMEVRPRANDSYHVITVRSTATYAKDLSNNTVASVAALEFFYAERPPALKKAAQVVSYAAGAGVEAAALLAILTPMLCERHVTRHADTAINSAIKLSAWAQVFTMTSFLQISALSEEYRSTALLFDWAMLDIGIPWLDLTSSSTKSGSARRRLLDPTVQGNVTTVDPASWATALQDTMASRRLKYDPYEQAQLYGYSVAFIGGAIFGLHLLYLIAATLIGFRVPPILLFPRLELYLVLFVMPIVGFLAGSVLGRGEIWTSAIVFVVYPLPLLIGCSYLLIKVLLLPHPNIRRIFYEVQYNERSINKLKAHRRRLPFYRRLLNGFLRVPAEWKTLPGDRHAADMLSRFLPLLGGLRGPAAVRLGDSYSVNPWTLRVKRGFLEPLMDTDVAEKATGLTRFTFRLKSAEYLLSSFGIIWNVAKTFIMAVVLGYYKEGGRLGERQASILFVIAAAHAGWLLVIRPSENTYDGRRDLLSSVIEAAGFGLAVALASKGHQGEKAGGLSYASCLTISRAMIYLYGGAILMYLATVYLDIFRTALSALRHMRSAPRRAFEHAGKTVTRTVSIRKFVNRWMCRALHRPLTGWPKINALTYMEQKLVEVLLESYPGAGHRNIKKEETWDSLGVWLLGSCPPPEVLLDLIERAAETKSIWREWLAPCASRDEALLKLLELLHSAMGPSLRGFMRPVPEHQLDRHTRDLVPVGHKPGPARGSMDAADDRMSLVPVGHQSLYVPPSAASSGNGAAKASPTHAANATRGVTQTVSIRAGSLNGGTAAPPIDLAQEEVPSAAPGLTLTLPTFNAGTWGNSKGAARAPSNLSNPGSLRFTDSPTDGFVRDRPSTAQSSGAIDGPEPSGGRSPTAGGSRPDSRAPGAGSKSLHHSGFLSAFLHMMGIDHAPEKAPPPPAAPKPPARPREVDPMLQEVPHVVDAQWIDEPRNMSGNGAPREYKDDDREHSSKGSGRTEYAAPPQQAEESSTFLWFLGKKGKKKKDKKKKGKFWVNEDPEAARGSGGARASKIAPMPSGGTAPPLLMIASGPVHDPVPPVDAYPAAFPPAQPAASEALTDALLALDPATQSAVLALLEMVAVGGDIDTMCTFDEPTGLFALEHAGTRFFVLGHVIEIVIREAERRAAAAATPGEALSPVTPGYNARKSPAGSIPGGLPAPSAPAQRASPGGTFGGGGNTRGASLKKPAGGWSFFWGDKRGDTAKGHRRQDTSDEIVLDIGPRRPSPQPPSPAGDRATGAWTPERQVQMDLESAIEMSQRLRLLAQAAKQKRRDY